MAGLLCSLSARTFAQETPVSPPSLPQIPERPSPQADQSAGPKPTDGRKPGAAPTGPGAPVNSSSYKIGPADVLNIHVWNEAEFSGPVMVHEDGMFTLALVGDLKAGGMTPVEVQDEIGKALAKYVVKPLVTVTVQDVGSKRYYMDGEINRPGEYTLLVPTTILEAISKAGGVHEFANSKKIYVLRGSQRIRFNYRDVLRGRNMSQNIELKPGDHVVVP
ncbi:MAG: polysaccharide biosynthesis/export family protein [Acidobacteriota bacterium]|nr:polysaccharide biosynthesis/export family protein [Acidobacteriota bacterium]